MYRLTIFLLMISATFVAQTKKKAVDPKKPATESDKPLLPTDTIDKGEVAIREARKFAVYSKRARSRTENRMKLCVQLVNPDTVFTYCSNDSLTKNPEKSKILFEKMDGDTNYVLVYTEAFSKAPDKPDCDGGRETKLYFFRWHPASNQAIVKHRIINSCMRAITDMSKQPVGDWDGTSPLTVEYHRGGTKFVTLTFDPAQYKKGMYGSDPDK